MIEATVLLMLISQWYIKLFILFYPFEYAAVKFYDHDNFNFIGIYIGLFFIMLAFY